MKNNLHQRLRSVLKGAIKEYHTVDDHLDLHGELRRHVCAIHECDAGLLLLDEAMDGDRFTNDQIAADYANLIRGYRALVPVSGAAFRGWMLDQLLVDIAAAVTPQEPNHAAP